MALTSLVRSPRSVPRVQLFANLVAVVGLAATVIGCSDRRSVIPPIIPDGGLRDGSGGDGSGNGDAPDAPIFTLDAPGGDRPDAPPCTPVVCKGPNYKFCGMIGDGCGNVVECGGCEGGEVCGSVTRGVCGGGPGCVPVTCDSPSGRFCGSIG